MRVLKDKKTKDLHIHLDGETEAYANVNYGVAKWGKYSSIFVSLPQAVAVKLAKQILLKYKEAK